MELWNFNNNENMSYQSFGGETLMKWREPNAFVRRFFKILVIFFAFSLLLLFVVFGVVSATKSNGQPTKDSFFIFVVVPIIFSVWLLATWFLPGASIHLKELCVTRREVKYRCRSNYSEIESATVHHDNYKDKRFFVIRFKLKNQPKSWINTFKVDQIVVPQNVNLEQVLQILRDKGVKCH